MTSTGRQIDIYRAAFYDPNGRDPNLMEKFASWHEENYVGYSNAEYDNLIQNGAISTGEQRQSYYIQAERLLCEEDVVIIPIFHTFIQ